MHPEVVEEEEEEEETQVTRRPPRALLQMLLILRMPSMPPSIEHSLSHTLPTPCVAGQRRILREQGNGGRGGGMSIWRRLCRVGFVGWLMWLDLWWLSGR